LERTIQSLCSVSARPTRSFFGQSVRRIRATHLQAVFRLMAYRAASSVIVQSSCSQSAINATR
jgi:hypothetical protein